MHYIMTMAGTLHPLVTASVGGNTPTEFVAWIVVPLIVFILGASATGITLLIKGSAYMARSQVAQEATRDSNQEISEKLGKFMERTDQRINGLDIRLSVVESARHNGHGGSRYDD
jgi:hypothetical protein